MKIFHKKVLGTKPILNKKDKIFFFVALPSISFIVYLINFSFYD